MKKIPFILLGLIVGAAIVGAVWILQPEKTEPSSSVVKYNCELSDGKFIDGKCECPVEEGLHQTSDSMYDSSTGFCQSAIGAPAGDALYASVGLPYGSFEFYLDIINYQCEQSGGHFLNARCDCGERSYNEATGHCSSEVVNEDEFYSSQYYSFSKPSDLVVSESTLAGGLYMTDSEVDGPLGIKNGEIWISISPTTEQEYTSWIDSNKSVFETTYVQDGPIHATEYVKLESGFYIMYLIVGGGERTERGREAFSLVSSTIK